jgi:hypothetical protein
MCGTGRVRDQAAGQNGAVYPLRSFYMTREGRWALTDRPNARTVAYGLYNARETSSAISRSAG